MAAPLVRLIDVSLSMPGCPTGQRILKNISWDILPARHCALLGANGSGKSSLLKLIHGDLWPAAGQILWLNAGSYEDSPIIGRRVSSLVSPQIQAACQRHAWDVSGMAILSGGADDAPFSFDIQPDAARTEAIHSFMEKLGAAELLAQKLPELSQGQLRFLLICRELLRRPALLLLDEWSEGLDRQRQRQVEKALTEMSAQTVCIFATHRQDTIPDWATERRWLEDGRILNTAPAAKAAVVAALPASVPPSTPAAKPIFELENVSVYIERKQVLKNIFWRLEQGESWLIRGTNGSGKSTFLRLLAGDEFAHADGVLKHWSPNSGYVDTLAVKRKSVSLVSDLGEALYAYDLSGLGLLQSGFENSIGLYREYTASETAWAFSLLNFFFPQNPKEIAESSIRRLSSGQLRRLYLARALVCRPDVLLLDEPCSGLDTASKALFLQLLAKLATEGASGMRPSIVLVTHELEDMPEIRMKCATMTSGRLVS